MNYLADDVTGLSPIDEESQTTLGFEMAISVASATRNRMHLPHKPQDLSLIVMYDSLVRLPRGVVLRAR